MGFATNIGLQVWPDQLHEYPNYLGFLLGPYILGENRRRAKSNFTLQRRGYVMDLPGAGPSGGAVAKILLVDDQRLLREELGLM